MDSGEDDIVLTERLTGVPVAVIRNAYVERLGTKAGAFARWMLKGRKTKHWMRTWYALNSIRRLKKSLMTEDTSTRVLAGGQVGRGDSRGQAGRADRAGVRLGAALTFVGAI